MRVNPANIPYWQDKTTELIWKRAQLTINDQVSVNALTQIYNIPESTLRRLSTAITTRLSEKYELAKQVHKRLTRPQSPN
jgi:hypothetical protein